MSEILIIPIKAGIAGSLILGLIGMSVFGKDGGTIATIIGLMGGPLVYNAWLYLRRKLNPFICPTCESTESELLRREIESKVVPKPIHRSDFMCYKGTKYFGNNRSVINRVEGINVTRTIYEEVRKCNNCSHIQSRRTFSVDTNIYFEEHNAIC